MPTVCVGGSRAASALSAAGQTAAQAYGLGAGDVGLLKGSTRPPEPPSLDPIDIMGPGAAAAETKQPKLLSYRNSMVSLMRYHESNFVREAKRYQVFPTVDYVSGDVEQLQEEGGYEQLVGVKTFRRFEDMLENGFEYRRSHFQRGFCDYVLPALAANLMGPADWERAGPQVIKQKGWQAKDLSKVKMGQAPRRFGKSQTVGRVATSFGTCKPGSVQAIFSTGRRASKNLLDIMFKGLTELGLAVPPYLTRFNNEELFFRPDGPFGLESRIYSYPAKAKARASRFSPLWLSYLIHDNR